MVWVWTTPPYHDKTQKDGEDSPPTDDGWVKMGEPFLGRTHWRKPIRNEDRYGICGLASPELRCRA